MNRTDKFEKNKITKASTNKVVCNVWYDSFGIEKVRFQNAKYDGDRESIDFYVDFEDMALLAQDAASGRIIKELDKGPINLYLGGTKSSKNYNGGPESRVFSLGKSGEGDKTKIFINLSRGKGKITETGAIAPDGAPDLKIGVPMTIDKFRSMMIYIHDWINAYLAHLTNALVKQCEQERKEFQSSNNN